MGRVQIYANQSTKISGVPDGVSPGTNYSGETYSTGLNAGAMLFSFTSTDVPRNRVITGLEFYGFVIPYTHSNQWSPAQTYATQLKCYPIAAAWFQGDVTWNTKPSRESKPIFLTTASNVQNGMYVEGEANMLLSYGLDYVLKVLRYGLYCEVTANSYTAIDGATVATSRAPLAQQPYIIVEYSDEEAHIEIASLSPTSGNYPKAEPTTFTWSTRGPSGTLDPITAVSSVFRWRPAGETEYTEVTLEGAANNSYTVPGGTFEDDNIEWQVAVTDNTGHTETSTWYTINTSDVPYWATILSPKNEIVDGSKPIEIRFQVTNPTRLPPQEILFGYYGTDGQWWQWRIPGSTWSDWNVTGVTRTWEMPLDAKQPTGEMRIRIVVENSEGREGPAATSTFVRIAAPSAPNVTVNPVPFAEITWQSAEQAAYRVTVDGTVYGPYFGSVNAFTVPEMLADGQHTAAVEVQGSYGLWSAPGTVAFDVQNAGDPDALELAASFETDVTLTMIPDWDGPYRFVIYRDGRVIATTERTQYVDRLSQGEHSYHVVARLADGNANISNTVTGRASVEGVWIAPLEGGDWLRLRYTATGDDFHRYSFSRTATLRHLAGKAWPVAELSAYRDASGTYTCAFLLDDPDAERLEALRGRAVLLKARNGVVLPGVLTSLQKAVGTMYKTYSFTLQRIFVEGLDDGTDG